MEGLGMFVAQGRRVLDRFCLLRKGLASNS